MCLGVPARVIAVRRDSASPIVEGTVDFGGVRKDVNLSFTPDVLPGDFVLVHVGFALSRLDEAEALRTLGYLEEIGQVLEEQEGAS